MSHSRPKRAAVTTTVLAVTLAMTGCAQQQSDYGTEIADRLQGEVLEVSELSAQADFDGALLALSELEVELKDARARGALTEERYESILAATALVRADLQAAIDALTPPPPVVVDGSGDTANDDDNNDDNDNSDNNDSDNNDNEGKVKGKGNDNKGNKGKGNNNGNDKGN
jgi:ABC-type Na+ efflux pump permease subunit